jgi:chromosome segregation ATPase
MENSKGTIEALREELSTAREEIKALKEDNRAKMEILQNTNKNILATRNEINMWKKCIDDKNNSIQELRKEIRKKDEEIIRLQKAYNTAAEAPFDAQTEVKHLKTILHLKESELQELKAKGQSYYTQADEILESQRKEIEMLRVRSSTLEDELRDCMEEKDQLEAEVEKLKSEEYINIRKNDEIKALIEKFREEKARLLKDLEILNKENDKLAGHNNLAQKIKVHERLKEENNNLKGQIQRMKDDLQHKSELISQLQRRAPESKRKPNLEETVLQKQIEKQAEEINNLTEGLAKITDYVFSLPIVTFNPEETSIVESTIHAISNIYETLEETEKVLQEKERELTNIKTRMNLMESENKIWKHKNEISQVATNSSLISGSSFKSPVAHYHALLNASSIKPSDFLAPFDNSKTPPKQRYRE